MFGKKTVIKLHKDKESPDIIFVEFMKDKEDHILVKKTCKLKTIKKLEKELKVYSDKKTSLEQVAIFQ